MGMGAALQPYKDLHSKVTHGVFSAFDMGDMLTLKVKEEAVAQGGG